MAVWTITPGQLPKVLEGHAKALPAATQRGILKSALRTKAALVRVSPSYTGQFRNSWKIVGNGKGIHGGIQVTNDAPHAGIIEQGARPHPVSKEGIEALTRWARLVILRGMSKKKYEAKTGRKAARGAAGESWVDKEARGIAFAIAAKLRKKGQKGLFLVDSRMSTFSAWLREEVHREVAKALAKKYGGA